MRLKETPAQQLDRLVVRLRDACEDIESDSDADCNAIRLIANEIETMAQDLAHWGR